MIDLHRAYPGLAGSMALETLRFGATPSAPATVAGDRAVLLQLVESALRAALAVQDIEAARGLTWAKAHLATAQLDRAGLYGLAFDEAIRVARAPYTSDLVAAIEAAQTSRLPGVRGWGGSVEKPESETLRWWTRHLAATMVADGNPDLVTVGPGVLATAKALVDAPAWSVDRPATRPELLTMFEWLERQSPLPAGAVFTRRFLALHRATANYRAPRAGDVVGDLLQAGNQDLRDLAGWAGRRAEEGTGWTALAFGAGLVGAGVYTAWPWLKGARAVLRRKAPR